MSYETANTHFNKWTDSLQTGDKIEIWDNNSYSIHSLGIYTVKKNENNNVIFTRMILQYNNWGFEYDEKNQLNINDTTFKNYTFRDPTETKDIDKKKTFDTWYDSIAENKMYNLKEDCFMGGFLEGNYHAKKYETDNGVKLVLFTRETSIMYRFWESDENNSICISEYGTCVSSNNKCKSFITYNYYSKNKYLGLAEDEAKYPPKIPRGWF